MKFKIDPKNITSIRSLLVLLSLITACLTSNAAVIEVKPNAKLPTGLIQKAIDRANNGDVVLVYPGTFSENLDLGKKQIVIESKQGASSTIIIANNKLDSVVTLNGGTIRGFTLTGGTGRPRKSSYGNDYYGGGVYASGNSIIENCIIFGNGHGKPKVNSGTFAGGVYAGGKGANVVIRNSLLYDNFAWASGGAVLTDHGAEIRIENSTLYGNQSTNFFGHQGGVAMANGGKVEIVNSILWANSGDEIGAFAGIYSQGTQAIVRYSMIEGGHQGEGNLFVAQPGFINPSEVAGSDSILGTKDDGLRPTAESPIIGQANAEEFTNLTGTDLAGFLRLQGAKPEIGCYEFGNLVNSDRDTPPPPPATDPGTPPDPDYKETIAELKRLLAEKDKKLAHCETEMAAKEKQVGELTLEKRELEGEVKSLNGKVTGLEKEVATLKSDNEGLQGQIQNLREDNQNLNYELTTTTEHLEEAIKVAETPFINGWVYDPVRGWLFTDAEHFPLVYTHNDQSWNYYELGSSDPRYFYNYTTQEWVAWDAEPQEADQLVATNNNL
jgi:hypothetical protein